MFLSITLRRLKKMEEIKKDVWIKIYHGEYGKEIVKIEILTDSKEQAYQVKEHYKELIKKDMENPKC